MWTRISVPIKKILVPRVRIELTTFRLLCRFVIMRLTRYLLRYQGTHPYLWLKDLRTVTLLGIYIIKTLSRGSMGFQLVARQKDAHNQ